MKKNSKQRCSKKSTKQKIISELKLLTYDIGNPGLGLEQVQICGGVKPVIFVMCSKGCLDPSTFSPLG
jgi:hypothetical protein